MVERMSMIVRAALKYSSNSIECHSGEVTLTGRVLPIGGVKEKTLAARRSGVKTLIFPKANKYDYDELTGKSHPHGNMYCLTCFVITIKRAIPV